jgi:hypothetical protein
VAFAAKFVRIAHSFWISGLDAIQVLVAGDMRMGELAHEMARDGATKNPAGFRSRSLRKRVQFGAGQSGEA